MIRGSCLCGGVRFEVRKAQGPFELCHCSRCRKFTGSAFAADIFVTADDFTLLQGQELIRVFEAPLRRAPPAYHSCFCSGCGSRVPDAYSSAPLITIPAGCLDDDPGMRPEMHIYVEHRAPWFGISDILPQLDRLAVRKYRASSS